jgi:hypothetical protein
MCRDVGLTHSADVTPTLQYWSRELILSEEDVGNI